MTFQLDQAWLADVRDILHRHLPDRSVWALALACRGRRVSGLIWIWSYAPLDLLAYGNLKDSFIESDLPIRVDIVDGACISEAFCAEITQHHEVIQ